MSGTNLDVPGMLISRITATELAELGILKNPRIIMRNGEFVPVFKADGIDVCLKKLNGFPVSYKLLNSARDCTAKLGFSPSEVLEGQPHNH